jgi:predicted NAD/FAD-binding protein
MPRRRKVWSAWNYLRDSQAGGDAQICVSYWMNCLQGIDPATPLFVTLNPAIEPAPELSFGEWSFSHPQFDSAAISAQARLDDIQEFHHTSYAGAWTGYGFHEDGLRSGLNVAERLGASIPWRKRPAPAPLPLAAE